MLSISHRISGVVTSLAAVGLVLWRSRRPPDRRLTRPHKLYWRHRSAKPALSSPRSLSSCTFVPASVSAKEGVEHWWRERLTAVALIPLTLWFSAIITHGENGAFIVWLRAPFTALMMVLLLVAIFHRAWSAGDYRGLRPFSGQDSGSDAWSLI